MNWENLLQLLNPLVEVLPTVAGALVLVLGGLLAAGILAKGTRWLVRAFSLDSLAERIGLPRTLYRLGIRMSVADLLARVVFVAVLVVTLSALAESLGLPGVARLASSVAALVPRLLVAVVVGAVGGVSADVIRRVIRRQGGEGDLESRRALADVAYYTIIVITVAVALEQAGLQSELVSILIVIVTTVGAVTLAVAFLLAGRAILPHYGARLYYESLLQSGDQVSVKNAKGRVLRTSTTSLILGDTEGHEVIVPFQILLQNVVSIERADVEAHEPGEPS